MENNAINKTGSTSTDGGSVDRVVINVGGMRFETHRATLQNISDTRLAWLTENADPNTKEQDWFFDRHPGAFVYILNFYRTGKLHTPTDMCGPAFEEELTFWGIDEKQMEPCCWETFTRHREAEENLKNFEGPGFDDLRQERRKSIQPMRDSGRLTRYYNIMWKILDDPHSSKRAKIFSLFSCFMIILSVSGYCLSTVPSLKRHDELLENINYICVVFFTIECTLRLITTPNRKEFMFDHNNWIDFISVVPSYLVLILKERWVKNLVIIRLLRVFKFFKLSYGLQVLLHTLKASSYELTLLLLMLLIPVVIFSSLVFAIESNLQPNGQFTSIPTTFWWCIITMTTVGYGDLTPKTWGGQLVGTVCAIFGILTVALPISVIGGNFSLYYAHVRARLKLPQKNRRHLQVNMHGLLRQTTSLSSRDRDRKLLRRNQISQNVTAKSEPKRFLDKLFHKPHDASPKHDIDMSHSRLQRGRGLRRTALMNADSSDNESNNDASATSSPFLKPDDANSITLIPNPLAEGNTPPGKNMKKPPDKRVCTARGRMRRTALINVESSDNESVESNISINASCKTEVATPLCNGPQSLRRVSNASNESTNKKKDGASSQENLLSPKYFSTESNQILLIPTSDDSLHDQTDTEENAKQHNPVFEVDPGGTDEDEGIVFEACMYEDEDENEFELLEVRSENKLNQLVVNLDRLKTLSKSLDERMFFDPPMDEEKLQSASRRNSMKLLTDCDQPMEKVNNENESLVEKNNKNDVIMNFENNSIFPKRGSIPFDRKRNKKERKNSDDYGSKESENILNNSLNNNDFSNYRRDRCCDEIGRNEGNDIFAENRTNNNILQKNVSLPVDVCMTRIDDFGNKHEYSSYPEMKIDTDSKFKKKLGRKALLRNKMRSEGDEDTDLLSPTYLNNNFRRMRKESIV